MFVVYRLRRTSRDADLSQGIHRRSDRRSMSKDRVFGGAWLRGLTTAQPYFDLRNMSSRPSPRHRKRLEEAALVILRGHMETANDKVTGTLCRADGARMFRLQMQPREKFFKPV